MKIVYVYDTSMASETVTEMGGRDRSVYYGPICIAVCLAEEVEERIAEFSESADDRGKGYLVVDATEYLAYPDVQQLTEVPD